MQIFGLIREFITEHGSAAIQKAHIEFLRDQLDHPVSHSEKPGGQRPSSIAHPDASDLGLQQKDHATPIPVAHSEASDLCPQSEDQKPRQDVGNYPVASNPKMNRFGVTWRR